MDIHALLQAGESKTLEFKQDASSLLPIIKTLIAFANTAGGILLIGVTDNHELLNVAEPEQLRDRLSSSIGDSIQPQLHADIKKISYQNKTLLAISVEKGRVPYYLKSEGLEKGAYVRVGATTRIATPETIAEIFRQVKHIFYDTQPCMDASLEEIDPHLLQAYFDKIQQPNNQQALVSLGLVTKEAGRVVPTNASMILFGKKEKRLHLFPNTRISCARFKGTTKAIFIDRQDYEFDFFTAIDEVQHFIQRHTMNSVKFEGFYRKDIPEYPPVAIREILINAFVHTNYEAQGSHFMIAVYDDRIEIQNPGSFPLNLTFEEFKSGISQIRNPTIARVFREVGLIEEWGSGYKRINEACQELGCIQLPVWQEFGLVLRVIIYPRPALDLGPDLVPNRDQVGIMSGSSWDHVEDKAKLDTEFKKILVLTQTPQALTALMDGVGRRNKTKFRQKYIYPLLEQKLLAMTIPDKPNSRLQQYVITPEGLLYLKRGGSHE